MEQDGRRGGLGCAVGGNNGNLHHQILPPCGCWVAQYMSPRLCLLQSRCKAEETYWCCSSITRGKGGNAVLPKEITAVALAASGSSGRHFGMAAHPGAVDNRLGLPTLTSQIQFHVVLQIIFELKSHRYQFSHSSFSTVAQSEGVTALCFARHFNMWCKQPPFLWSHSGQLEQS